MDEQKLHFITKECMPLFKSLPADTTGKWGKMNSQQMVEHVAAFFLVSIEIIYSRPFDEKPPSPLLKTNSLGNANSTATAEGL